MTWMSSLRDFDRVEDRIRQHRQVEKVAVVIVEGPDDLLVLKHHIPEGLIFPADGKRNALRAVNALRDWGIRGVRAVVDADFDEQEPDACVLLYEQRDLEAMLIDLGSLASVLEHQGSTEKLAAVGGAAAFVAGLVAQLLPIARLRQTSMREGWGLDFNEVDLASKANRHTLTIELDRYAAAIVQASDTGATILQARAALHEGDLDDRGARGKDVVALAGVALRSKIGTLPQAACDEPRLSAQLRSTGAFALEQSAWMSQLRTEVRSAEAELERGAA
jgi:hypothetical protein